MGGVNKYVIPKLIAKAEAAEAKLRAVAALRDTLLEWAAVASANKDTIAGTFVGLSDRLDSILGVKP